LWQWGQFVDHDIDLTDGSDPPDLMHIPVPLGDPEFDPAGSGVATIPMNRSLFDPATGIDTPRQQTNEITAWIDASNVYGSDADRAAALRENDGSGRLKVSAGDLLPFNTGGLPNAGGSSADLFLAGDVRANEQVALTVMHTLFVREHNRLANQIAGANPNLSGDQIYQRARRLVGAMMQAITYRQFLPALLGQDALPAYSGYDRRVDAGIANLFSTASYHFGHSALSPTLLRLDADGNPIAAGSLKLRNAFFAPSAISEAGGLEPYLRGLATQQHQEIDPYVIDDGRNFLFGEPGQGGIRSGVAEPHARSGPRPARLQRRSAGHGAVPESELCGYQQRSRDSGRCLPCADQRARTDQHAKAEQAATPIDACPDPDCRWHEARFRQRSRKPRAA
jgi:peroxidase